MPAPDERGAPGAPGDSGASGDAPFQADLDAEAPWIRSQAQRALGRRLRSTLDSEDIAQEARLRALPHLDAKRFPNRRAFRGWLRTIVRNVAAQTGRRPRIGEGGVEWGEVAGEERSPSSKARRKESVLVVRRMLGRLPERDRKVVALRLEEDLPFKEVAQRLDLSESHARMIFSRSIRKLREDGGEPDPGAG